MTPLRSILTVWTLLGLMAGCVGCSSQPISGVIERPPVPAIGSVGSLAYDIPFTAPDGKRTTLRSVREPVTILAFVDTPGEACCAAESEVANLAGSFRRLPVTVVQVSMPTSACAHNLGRMPVCHVKESDAIVLCDRDRIAWDGYGRPSSGTLVLIDKRGVIAEVSDMRDLRAFSQKATWLALKDLPLYLD